MVSLHNFKYLVCNEAPAFNDEKDSDTEKKNKWTYSNGECIRFEATGAGNANRFNSSKDCEDKCIRGKIWKLLYIYTQASIYIIILEIKILFNNFNNILNPT